MNADELKMINFTTFVDNESKSAHEHYGEINCITTLYVKNEQIFTKKSGK